MGKVQNQKKRNRTLMQFLDEKFRRIQNFVFSNKVMLFLACLVFVFLIYCFLKLVFTGIYAINDDTTMRAIVSGEVGGTPDPHIVFMLYPVGLLLSSLYRITVAIDWYSIFMVGMVILSLSGIMYRILSLFYGRKRKLGLIVFLVILFVFHRHIIMPQFTMVAAFLAAACIFWYITQREDLEKNEWLYDSGICALYMFGALCVRYYVFLLMVPVMGIAFLIRTIKFPQIRRREIFFAVVCGIVFLSLLVVEKVEYSSDEYKNYISYSEARSKIYDVYGFPDYETNKQFYDSIDITKIEYESLCDYNLMLPNVDDKTLWKIVDYQKEQKKQNIFLDFQRIFRDCLNPFVQNTSTTVASIVTVILLGAALFLSFKKQDFDNILLIFGGVLWGWGVIFWYVYNQRFHERIVLPLLMILCLLAMKIIILLAEPRAITKKNKLFCAFFNDSSTSHCFMCRNKKQ
jgi:hypothetical protein